MALNKALLGKKFDPIPMTVDREQAKKYAMGSNDYDTWYLTEKCEGGAICPPMFAVVFTGPSFISPCFDPELGVNFARLVHGSQDFTFHKPIRGGEEIATASHIAGIEEKASGDLLTIGFESRDTKTNDLVVSGQAQFFIRGSKKDAGVKKEEPKQEETRGQIVLTNKMYVTKDQSYRYAEGSGDHNTIHVDPEFAKNVGLPGIILQGLCTMAFVQKAVVDEICGGNPLKLKRLKCRFSKAVLPGEIITTEGWIKEKKGKITVLGLEAKNQDGAKVVTDGLAEVETE